MTTPNHPSPTTSAYVDETLALLGDRDPIASMQEMPGWLTAHLDDLPEEALYVPEAPGKWSIAQVLAHLADAELAFGWRARIVLTQDRPPMQGYDENRWAERFRYEEADAAAAFHAWGMQRAWNLRIWETITPEEYARVGVHSERGEESLDRIIRMIAGHDLRHQRQITRIIKVIR